MRLYEMLLRYVITMWFGSSLAAIADQKRKCPVWTRISVVGKAVAENPQAHNTRCDCELVDRLCQRRYLSKWVIKGDLKI